MLPVRSVDFPIPGNCLGVGGAETGGRSPESNYEFALSCHVLSSPPLSSVAAQPNVNALVSAREMRIRVMMTF